MLMYLGWLVVLLILVFLLRLARSAGKEGDGSVGAHDIFQLPRGAGVVRPSLGAGGATDPATRLKQLEEVRDAGLITNDEYEAKRSEILDKI